MAPSQGWQELLLPSRRECPKLFYSYDSSADGFTLLITDLMALWQVAPDKYDIIAEASRQHCPIDPSESSRQLKVLLEKIEQSLQNGDNVLARETSKSSQNVLVLKTTIALPKPLRPLLWTFKLTPQSVSEMAELILRPSLHEVSVSQHKIESLNRIIKDKDHVISRLLDRVNDAGTDLSLMFPGITGLVPRRSGHVTVAEATKHVPGMGTFDQDSWSKQFEDEEQEYGPAARGLGKLVGGCEKCFVHTNAEHEDWLKGLPSPESSSFKSESKAKRTISRKVSTPPPRAAEESTASEDEFERQPTPPSTRKTKVTPDSADELDGLSSSGNRHNRGRLDALNARKKAKKSPSPASTNVRSTSKQQNNEEDDSKTETDSEQELARPAARKQTPSKPESNVRRLGKLGSRPKPSASPQPEPKPDRKATSPVAVAHLKSDNVSKSSATPPRRLGRLGGAQRNTNQDVHSASSDFEKSDSSPVTRTQNKEPAKSEAGDDSDATETASSSDETGKRHAKKESANPTISKTKSKLGQLKSRKPTSTEVHQGNNTKSETSKHQVSLSRSPSTASSSSPIRSTSKEQITNTAKLEKEQEKAQTPEPPPETEEQKANRRREELKRAIDNDANTKKKKRRF